MKVTIIYDNTASRNYLTADWGFSCLVEAKDIPKILFDTGTNGKILLSNMEKLDIDPQSIEEVFISHSHFDHVGGLSDFLRVNNNVRLYLPVFCPKNFEAKEIIEVPQPLKIQENIFSTGELQGIEQSLVVKTDKGLVVIVGCSYPGVENILNAASQSGKATSVP